MNNSRSLVMIVFSLLAGLAAVVFAGRWMASHASQSNKVVIAAVDVDLGQKLTPQMLELTDWPAGSVPKGAFTSIKALEARVLKTSLQKGEAVLEGKLAPMGTQGGLSAIVAEGKRAMTVRVNDVVGVAGFALPGNYVDIMVSTAQKATFDAQEETQISKIVLEHILVLAVAQEASRDETKPKVVNAVTLEVTPEQAELLDMARSAGQLSLVLRNQIDANPAKTEGATKLSLLGMPERPAPEPAKPAKAVVVKKKRPAQVAVAPAPIVLPSEPAVTNIEVIKGLDRFTQQFESAE